MVYKSAKELNYKSKVYKVDVSSQDETNNADPEFITRTRSANGVKWLVVVSICTVYMCVFVDKKYFESYFSDRLTFQTFAVGLLVELID